ASNRGCRAPTWKTSDRVLPLLLQTCMEGPHFLIVGLEELGASTQKHQSTTAKHPDASPEQQRFPDIMGDKQRRLAECVAQIDEHVLQFHTRHRIKRTKGFVQQQ